MDNLPSRISLTTPVNYRIVRAILESRESFYQTEIADQARANQGQVSRLVRWLEARGHIRRGVDGGYRVSRPAGLVTAVFPYTRAMSSAFVGTGRATGQLDKIAEALADHEAVLCLESALAAYSGYFRPDRVAVYHREPEKLMQILAAQEGGLVPVDVYVPDLPLRGDTEGPDELSPCRTTRFRTLIDLVCDDRAYAAKDLFAELWGVAVG